MLLLRRLDDEFGIMARAAVEAFLVVGEREARAALGAGLVLLDDCVAFLLVRVPDALEFAFHFLFSFFM